MKILIAGAGEVGYHLAKLFSYESHDIMLIDVNEERLSYADKNLDIQTIEGDATSPKLLANANAHSADLVIAATSNQSININVCIFAKQLGSKRTIARVRSQELISEKLKINLKNLGIDEVISPEFLAADEIKLLLNQSGFTDTFEFDEGALRMIGVTLRAQAAFVGKTVKEVAEVYPGIHFVPIAIQRHGTQYTVIPRGDTQFKRGDQVYFVTDDEGVEELYNLTGADKRVIKNVMILGGSNIGKMLARELAECKYNVKLIERNEKKAFEIADEIPDILVIHEDGRDVSLLEDENISKMDAFISVTGNSETNIMSSLIAKTKKVKKTIALVENMDYFQLSHNMGIDSFVNKKLIAANDIFRFIRKGNLVSMTKLNNMNAELLEFKVKKSSMVCNRKISDIDFPRTSVVGGVIRDGKGKIALGEFVVKEGDRLVVCCLPKSIKRVEKLFS